MPKHAKTIVEYRVYDLPFDFPAIILHGEEWRISDIMSTRMHFHNCLEIGLCHTDCGTMVIEDKPLPVQAGDATVIPRHVPHTTYSAKGTRSLWTYVFLDIDELLARDDPQNAKAFAKMLSSVKDWIYTEAEHPRINFLAKNIVDELLMRHGQYITVVRHLLMVLCHDLIRLRSGEGWDAKANPGGFTLKPALEHIANHYMDAIAVDELADMCGLSTSHFRRLFADMVGESPVSFLNTTRIDRACALLLTTEDSIVDIANAVGFPSISCFNRYFSLVMGISPRAFRSPIIRDSVQPDRKRVLRYKGWTKPDF